MSGGNRGVIWLEGNSKTSPPAVVLLFVVVIVVVCCLQYVFQPAMLYMERIDTRTEEGLVVFSRHPILSSDYIFLYRWVWHLIQQSL